MAHFFERHQGIAGAGVPLPEGARLIAERYEGTDDDPAELVRELREMYPEGDVRDVPPKDSPGRGFGMITLMLPAAGFPRHGWRVIKYRPTKDVPVSGAAMGDLPYKLNQIAKSLHDLGHGAWGDAVAAAGGEIERLGHARREPGPATARMVAKLQEMPPHWREMGLDLAARSEVLGSITIADVLAFLAEQGDGD